MCSICPTVYLSVCLSVSIHLSVCLSAYQPAYQSACLSLRPSVSLSVFSSCLCLYVCPFSIFQSSAANLSALYLSVHPFVHLSVSLYSIFPFACMSFCLSVVPALYKIHLKKRIRVYPSLIIAIWFLIGKTSKLKIPKIIHPVS